MAIYKSLIIGIVLLGTAMLSCSCTMTMKGSETFPVNEKRVLRPFIHDQWIGSGISYSPYRDGESPERGSLTSKEDILHDLNIVIEHWNFIRLYSSGEQSRRVLQVIRDNELPIRVMQGAWLSGHSSDQENEEEIKRLIDLANEFSDIILAVNIGNEIFVDWSAHRIENHDKVLEYIREVRGHIKQPVTVCDDYNFWNKPESSKIVKELDFIGLHAYAFWNNKTLAEAINWNMSIYKKIKALYPGIPLVFAESGWPTSRVYDDSYEGKLIGKAGEKEQAEYFEKYSQWVNSQKVISFYFEAFDENWKGGQDGINARSKAEKHWGLYYSDRKPKLSIR